MKPEYYALIGLGTGFIMQIIGEVAVDGSWFKRKKLYFTIPILFISLIFGCFAVFDKPKEPKISIITNPVKHDTTTIHDLKKVRDSTKKTVIAPLVNLAMGDPGLVRLNKDTVKINFKLVILNDGIINGSGYSEDTYSIKNKRFFFSHSTHYEAQGYGKGQSASLIDLLKWPVKRSDSLIIIMKPYYGILSSSKKIYLSQTAYFITNDTLNVCSGNQIDSLRKYIKYK